MRKTLLAVVCALAVMPSRAQTLITPEDLTLDEKISLLSCNMGIERLGVPISFYAEGMHGIAYGGPSNWGQALPQIATTSFPQAFGLGHTWDPELLEAVATQESTEQRYCFQNPRLDRGGLIMWAPNVDLARDPRWGRTYESYGEDPWLISQMAMGFIRGAQGPDPEHWRTAALMKHFLANSYEYARYFSSSDISERMMREYYAYTFWKCITEGGCRGIMTAYNAVNGTPMTVHPILEDMVVGEWGMDGVICTDQDAMRRLVEVFEAYPDYAEATAAAVKAGITQFLSDKEDSEAAIREALSRGLITEADIDKVIRNNLNVMEKLGLLGGDDPYSGIGRDGSGLPSLDPDAQPLCRKATGESIVLLKNSGILPLDPSSLAKVAVIGPRADVVMQDWYGGTSPYKVSVYEGIREALGEDVEVTLVTSDFAGAGVRAAAEADVVIAVVSDNPAPCLDVQGGGAEIGWGTSQVASDGMEEVDRWSLTLSQEDMVKMLFNANRNTVMVLVSGFPYAINWSQDYVPAIMHVTHGSQEQGNAVADVLFGKVNPAGRLTMTWPTSITDLPEMSDYDITHGRTYMYSKAKPLYPFGYGLSYTTFKYGGFKISQDDGVFNLSVDVRNTGDMDGDEVVQVYVQYLHSRVLRPERQLRGFRRVSVPAGEKVTVTIPVKVDDLAYWDEGKHSFVVESGRVRFLVGASSTDIRRHKVRKVR